MSKTQLNWSTVSFGGTPINRVTTGGFSRGGSLAEFRGTPESFPSSYVINLYGGTNATFTTADVGIVMGMVPGTVDTLKATLGNHKSSVDFTMINAVLDNVKVSSACAQYRSVEPTWTAYSNDGRTNPLSFSVTSESIPYPDALMVPGPFKRGADFVNRVASIADIADPLLRVDRHRGERSYIRQQGEGQMFVTKSIYDTILFPMDHAKVGQPRYRWEPQASGIQLGYLVDGAKS